MGDEELTLNVDPDDAGERVDRLLAARLEALSRSRVQGLIRSGHVRNSRGTIEDAGYRVKSGEKIIVVVPPLEPVQPTAEARDLSIAYEDDHVVVVDKPAGLVVHPAPGHSSGTLVNALIAHCGDSLSGIGGVRRPGVVHRLDKDTSGLIVVAKTDAAHRGLTAQFAAHGRDGALERAYLALAWGAFDKPAGSIDAPLGRSLRNRTKISVSRGRVGRRAVTHYRVLERLGGGRGPVVSRVHLVLETGRTHQIRVHLAHIGHPLLGDPTYGAGFAASAKRLPAEARDSLSALGRQALHAAVLGFVHPLSGRWLRFESPLPSDMATLLKALGEN
jgi:23S rRNA pseudouridine1911/1915/1917 synthase